MGMQLHLSTQMKADRKHAAEAFTVVELLILVACLAILAAIILPSLARPSHCTGRINCTNNLKQIGLAFRTWSLDNNDKFPMHVSVTNGGAMEMVATGTAFTAFQVMSNELSTPKILFCPEENDRKRIAAVTFSSTVPKGVPANVIPFTGDNNVSYFVALDAQDTFPQQPLCGDRNLAIGGRPVPHGLVEVWTNTPVAWFGPRHNGNGNIALADGSIQQVTSPRLRIVFAQSGMATNRLAI